MAEKFKEISAAYSLLSDKDMKKRYDSGQVDGSGQQQNPFGGGGRNPFNTGFGGMGGMGGRARRGQMGGGDDMADLFSSLFGMNMGGQMGGQQQRRQPPQKGADIRYKIEVELKIPAGANTGQKMRLKGKGIAGGDLIVTLQIILGENDAQSLKDWANSDAPNAFDPRKALL